jgi:hypothetical protein
MKDASYEAPHYAVFAILLFPHFLSSKYYYKKYFLKINQS